MKGTIKTGSLGLLFGSREILLCARCYIVPKEIIQWGQKRNQEERPSLIVAKTFFNQKTFFRERSDTTFHDGIKFHTHGRIEQKHKETCSTRGRQ